MGIVKIPQWQNCFNGRVYSLLGRNFYWGLSDCVMVCAQCLDSMCGTSWWEAYKDRWTSRRGALKYGRTYGGFYDWLAAAGAVEVAVPELGDFVFSVDKIGMEAVGTVVGGGLAITSGEAAQVIRLEQLSVFFANEDNLKILRIPE